MDAVSDPWGPISVRVGTGGKTRMEGVALMRPDDITRSRRQVAEVLMGGGMVVVGLTVTSFALFSLYRLIGQVFAPLGAPIPAGYLLVVLTGAAIGVSMFLTGVALRRRARREELEYMVSRLGLEHERRPVSSQWGSLW